LNHQIALIFTTILYVLIGLVIARSLMSWFPVSPRNPFARFLQDATEPLLGPVRRILPRTGMIDFSAMVVIVLLYVMIYAVQQVSAG
jgi:YggT family protein